MLPLAIQVRRGRRNGHSVDLEVAGKRPRVAGGPSGAAVVKFELLADLGNEPAEATVAFKECENLGLESPRHVTRKYAN